MNGLIVDDYPRKIDMRLELEDVKRVWDRVKPCNERDMKFYAVIIHYSDMNVCPATIENDYEVSVGYWRETSYMSKSEGGISSYFCICSKETSTCSYILNIRNGNMLAVCPECMQRLRAKKCSRCGRAMKCDEVSPLCDTCCGR